MCVQRAINVGLSEQTLDGEQDGPDVIQGRPLVFQDVQTDVTLGVHIGMVAGCEELHRGRVVRVATGELQGQFIPQVFIYCASGSMDGPHPFEEVVGFREGRNSFIARHLGRKQHMLGWKSSLLGGQSVNPFLLTSHSDPK